MARRRREAAGAEFAGREDARGALEAARALVAALDGGAAVP
jgi:hypothetical protein